MPVARAYELAGGLNIETTYERIHTLGGSASNAFGELSLRTEIGYSSDRYAYTTDIGESGGVVRRGELAYVDTGDGLISTSLKYIYLTE